MSKIRNACFTLNNYNDDQYAQIVNFLSACKYYVIGKEVGASGTPHLQGYCEFPNSRSFKAVHRALFNAHIETRRGSAEQASDYCKKDGDYIEHGEISKQGERSDIQIIRDTLETHPSRPMRETTAIATSYQSIKVAEQYLKYHEIKRTWKPEVKWYYGPTGSGKTAQAIDELTDPYIWCTPKWWDGYDAHEHVLIDDFRKDFCTFHTLLRILDRYPHAVETKGGMRSLLAKKIIVTCPYHPEEVYATREDIQQLLRRIDEIKKFDINIDET